MESDQILAPQPQLVHNTLGPEQNVVALPESVGEANAGGGFAAADDEREQKDDETP